MGTFFSLTSSVAYLAFILVLSIQKWNLSAHEIYDLSPTSAEFNNARCFALKPIIFSHCSEMGGAYSMYEEEGRCLQGSDGETWGKENIWKTQA
jgi:hypothetical protein